MTVTDTRIPWPFARHIADEVAAELAGLCTRIQIAGSIRRRKPTVKDVEIIVIPITRPPQLDLLGKPITEPVDMLGLYLSEHVKGKAGIWKLRPAKDGRTTFGPMNKLLMRRTPDHPGGWMPVDVFTATEANWGRDLWVRTGPAELNTAIATLALNQKTPFHAYGPHAFTGERGPIQCPDEMSLAAFLEIAYPEPEMRTDALAVELLKRRRAP